MDVSNINPWQALVDAAGRGLQRARADRQMTLGALIAALEGLPPDKQVRGIGNARSYRGYYDDLAFAPSDEPRTVADLLSEARACMGKVFEGYKGGDYMMGERTPLWIADYGENSGLRLVGLDADGDVVPVTAQQE